MRITTSSKPCIGLFFFISFFLLASVESVAQNEVAIGSATTKSNAILWLNGNGSQGLILPVVTNKSAVTNPDKGMVVYDDSDNKVWYRSNSAWVEVGSGTGANTASLNLLLQGNQLQLRDGTTVLNSANIAGGTQANGSFLVFNGGSWQYATLSGDVTGANSALQVNGIKGKTIATLPATTQALVYDPSANAGAGGWSFQALTGGATVPTLNNGQLLTGNGTTNTATAISGDATLSGGAITIGNNAITTAKINAAAVDNTKLADNAVTTAKISDATITGSDIAGSTITADKLAQSAATTGQILKWNGTNWVPQNESISTTTILSNGQILTGNGTTNTATILTGDATLAGGVLTIGNNAITTPKINANAVDATKLADNAVTSVKISDATITGSDIANTTITGANISATTITADKLAQSAATSGQVLKWNGTSWVPAADDAGVGATPTLSSGQILTGNGTTNSAIALTGDATLAGGVITIGNNAITTAKINAAAVDATKLADNSVTTLKVADNAITTAKINAAAVDATKLADNAVTTLKVADNAITTTKISDGSITNLKVANDAITSANITNATITGADIAATTITADKLAQSTATSGQVLKWNGTNWVPAADDAGVGATPTLSSGQILTGNGTTNSATALTGDATLAGGVITIGNNAITTAKINAAAVDATKLADNSVTTLKVADNAITTAKINAAAVDATKLADNAVTTLKVADNAITTAKISDGSITNLKVANDAITSANITNATITGADIAATTITADKLAASSATSGQVLKWNGTNWVPAADDAGVGATPTLSSGQILTGDGTTNSATALTGDATLTGGTITISNNAITTAKINAAAVDASKLADNSVTTLKVADNAITTVKISDGSITNLKVANDAITSANITNATITGADIATTTITGANIAATTITADKLAASSATSGQVLKWNGTNWVPAADDAGVGATPTLSTGEILIGDGTTNAAVALTGDATLSGGVITIGSNAITSAKINDATITGADIAPTTITGANIAATTIDATKIIDGSITNLKVANDAITSAKISDATITGADISAATIAGSNIANTTITGANIAATTITADKLAASSATSGQVLKWNGTNWAPAADDAGVGATPTLSSGQILTGDGTTNSATALSGDATLAGGVITIGNNAITNAKINAAAVDATKLADNAVTTLKVADNAITTTKISDGSITNLKVANDAITSVNITNATITGADIAATTITADKLAQSTAAAGQVLQWNGSAWTPATLAGGGDMLKSTYDADNNNIVDVAATATTATTATTAAGLSITLPIASGGTGATDAATARTNLGLGSLATLNTVSGTNLDPAINISTSGTINSGAITATSFTGDGSGLTNLPAGTTYTAGTGLTLTTNAFSVNTSQNISTLSNLTTNGLIKTSGGTGALSVATAGTDYLAPNGDGSALTNLNAGNITSGTLPITNGGTGATTVAGAQANLGILPNTLGNGNIFVGSAGNVATSVTLSGDATVTNLGALTIANGAISGGVGGKILDASITDADINAAAGILGTKVSPDFGAQNISTTGSLFAGGGVNALAFGQTDGVALRGTSQNNSASSTGVFGVINSSGNTSPVNIGVRGYVDLTSVTSTNYGLMGSAINSGVTNYGVYGSAANATTNWAGYFEGNAAITGGLAVGGTPVFGTVGQVLTSQGPNVAPIWSAGGGSSFSTLNTIPKGNGSTLVASQIFDNGTSVGIGTATPIAAAKMDIRGSSTDDGGGINISNSDASHQMLIFPGRLNDPNPYIGVKTGDPIRFATFLSESSGFNELMRITSSGNVGIGTPTPADKLEVVGGGRFNSTSGRVRFHPDFPAAGATTLVGTFEGFSNNGPQVRFLGANAGANFIDIGQDGSGNFTVEDNDIAAITVTTGTRNVGIGTTTPGDKLDVNGAVLLESIAAPGTTTNRLYNEGGTLKWNGTSLLGGSGWSLTGNTGTTPGTAGALGTNFIGTTNNVGLDIVTNNTVKLKVTPKGQLEVYNTGQSVFLGEGAGANDDLTANLNTYIGTNSGKQTTSGNQNTAVGFGSLEVNSTGSYNTGLGMFSLWMTSGQQNTGVGYQALQMNTSGSNNTGIGHNSLITNTAGGNNTALGFAADVTSPALTNATAIGYNSKVGASNSLVLGGTGVDAVNVGIGTTNPRTDFQIGTASHLFASTLGTVLTQNIYENGGTLLHTTLGGASTLALQSDRVGLYVNSSAAADATFGSSLTNRMVLTQTGLSINKDAADASAVLHVVSQTVGGGGTPRGFMMPSLVTSDRDAIAAPLTGLMIFNQTTNAFNYYNGTAWQSLGGSSGWALGGNSTGLTDGAIGVGNNYIGTTTNVPLNFMVNNEKVGRIDPTNNNTFFGRAAGNANYFTGTGYANVAYGWNALSANVNGYENTAIGHNALANSTVPNNTAVGSYTLVTNTIGADNTGLGGSALEQNISGSNNVAIGHVALVSNTTGSSNTALGWRAGVTSTIANANVTGSNNTFIGVQTGPASATQLTNATAIGSNALVNASNTIQLGDASVTTVNVGTSTTAKLVAGGLQITGGTLAAGKVLTSDASGNATWQTPSGTSFTNVNTDFQFANGAARKISVAPEPNSGDPFSLTLKGSDATAGGAARNGGDVFIDGGHNYNISIPSAMPGSVYLRAGGNLTFGNSQPGDIILQTGGITGTPTAYDTRFIVKGNGNVGIGTATPTQKLDINGNVNISNTGVLSFGGVNVLNTSGNGNDVYANLRVIRNRSSTAQDGMYIGYDNTGGAAGHLRFYANGTTQRMHIDAGTGFVGIGTTVPNFPLEVQGSNYSNYFSGSNLVILSQPSGSAFWASGNFTPGATLTSASTSIRAQNYVVAEAFLAVSDSRIKKDIQISDASKDLQTLMQLKVSDYYFTDWVSRGSQLKKGFIAQEVKEVFPEAVTTNAKEIIPSVFAVANQVTKRNDDLYSVCVPASHGFVVGDRVKLITPEGEIIEQVTSVDGANCFSLKTNKIASTENVIVYGKEISDFHSVDYNQIHTLGISAIQELNKKLEAQQDVIDSLQAQDAESKKKIASLEASLQNVQSNNTDLEKLKAEMETIKKALGLSVEAAVPVKKEEKKNEQ